MNTVAAIKDKKQIQSLKKYLRGQNVRDYLLFTLGINSGLRISDLIGLYVEDVIENGKIKDRINIREKKTGKWKTFPLCQNSQKALSEYFQENNINLKAPLFPSRKGNNAITRVQAYRIINEAARHVGIKEQIGTHTLRKSFGYHAYVTFGNDIAKIQKLLNHSSQTVTLSYIGITKEDLDDVYINLNL